MSNLFTSSNDLSAEELARIKNFDPSADRVLDKPDSWYYNNTSLVSNSMLGQIAKGGPQRLHHYIEYPNQRKNTDAFIFGRAFHCAILEPDDFDDRFFCLDDTEIVLMIGGAKPRATKKYKEWKTEQLEENINKQIIELEDYNNIMRMRDVILNNIQCQQLLANGKREEIYYNELYGVKTKCKTDHINPGNYIVDIKTSRDAPTHEAFSHAVRYKYNYDRQGAFYRDTVHCPSFWFIVIEKTAPFTLGIYELSEESYDIGRRKYEELLAIYKHHFLNEERRQAINTFFFQGSV